MTKIIVFGSSGILGKIIVQQVVAQFGEKSVIVSDYLRERAEDLSKSLNISDKPRIIDVTDTSSINTNLEGICAAVIATKQHEPNIQEECIRRGIITVDVAVFKDFVGKVQKLGDMAKNHSVPALVMAGYFPGLSGVAVKELADYFDAAHGIRVSLLQNTKASAGKSGFADMLKVISSEIQTKRSRVEGFKIGQEFYHYDRDRTFRQYLIKSDEAEILSDEFHIDIAYYTGWEKKGFNRFVRFLNKTGLSRFLANNPTGLKIAAMLHPPRKYDETNREETSLTINGIGYKNMETVEKSIYINAKADYLATAISATTMLKMILEKRDRCGGGVFMPHQLFDLDTLKDYLPPSGVDIIKS